MLVGDDASPVSSMKSCSLEQGELGSWLSMPSSLKTDLRPLVTLFDREKDGGLPEPSRIRSSVHLWWNRGLAARPEDNSGADEGLGGWMEGMMSTAPWGIKAQPPVTTAGYAQGLFGYSGRFATDQVGGWADGRLETSNGVTAWSEPCRKRRSCRRNELQAMGGGQAGKMLLDLRCVIEESRQRRLWGLEIWTRSWEQGISPISIHLRIHSWRRRHDRRTSKGAAANKHG